MLPSCSMRFDRFRRRLSHVLPLPARRPGSTLTASAGVQAFRAAPSDGWTPLVTGETVSVYSNVTSKVPFPTTCVRCQFKCPVPPVEVVRHLQDLKARRERDFFFKDGKPVGARGDGKLVFQAVMKTLSASEERAVLVSHMWEQDAAGNWTIVEVPEGTHDLSGFTFPSFFVQSDAGGKESLVYALYRFDVRKVWKDSKLVLAGDAEDKIAEALSGRFSEFAQHTCLSLLMLGGGGGKPTPEPKPRVLAAPPPAAASPAARRQLNDAPADAAVTPPRAAPASTTTPSSAAKKKTGTEVGDLIEGAKYRWKKGEMIGHGAIGKVYMGLNFDTGEMMAVKQIQLAGTRTHTHTHTRTHTRACALAHTHKHTCCTYST